MIIWQLIGICLSISGVLSLYLGWKRKHRSWPHILSGWSLLLGSILAWGQTSGADKGAALGIIVVVLTGMTAVAVIAVKTPVKARRKPRKTATQGNMQASLWHEGLSITASILAIVIVGMIASIAACTAMFLTNRAVGVEHTANIILTMFAFPTLWAGLATYMGYSHNTVGKIRLLLGLVLVSCAVIFAMMRAWVA